MVTKAMITIPFWLLRLGGPAGAGGLVFSYQIERLCK